MAKQNNDTGCGGCIIELFAWIIMICFIMYIGIAIAGVVCVIGAIYGIFRLVKWIIYKKRIKKQDSTNNTDLKRNESEIKIQNTKKIQETANEIKFTDNSQYANNIDLINDYQLENPHVDTPQEIIYEEPITEIKEEDVIEETNIPYTEQAEPKEEIEQKEKQESNSEERQIKKPMEVIEVDDYFEEAGRFVIEAGRAAAGQLQRKFYIGFNRASRIIDQLHKAGIVGAADDIKPRKILMTMNDFDLLLGRVIPEETGVANAIQVKISKEAETQDIVNPISFVDYNQYMSVVDLMSSSEFEEFCANLLIVNGFINVNVTKGSGDRGIDILGEKNGIKYAVQCKRYSSKVGNHAIQEAFSGKAIYGADIAVVMTNCYFTKQARQDANSLDVWLWDRDKISSLITNKQNNSLVDSDIRNKEKEFENNENYYQYCEPSTMLLKLNYEIRSSDEELKRTAIKIQNLLKTFEIDVYMARVTTGGRFTRYEIQPKNGTRINKIKSLADDIKLNLMVKNVHIEAPIPGSSMIGIDIEEENIPITTIREMVECETFCNFPSDLVFPVGKDVIGKAIFEDIAQMPHLLIAGTTGSGKTTCINSIIMGVLYKAKPDDVKMIMIDTKGISLNIYNGIPHLFAPVITDDSKAISALKWVISEIENRYELLNYYRVQNLQEYNSIIEISSKMPRILIIIDDLCDLMTLCKNEAERLIVRIAQLSRKVGIHLIISTQRPSVDVITGLIKSNISSRIAFSVFSAIDSRVILDEKGAEELSGNGDMLFKSFNYKKPIRIQGTFVSDKEILNVVEFLKNNN